MCVSFATAVLLWSPTSCIRPGSHTFSIWLRPLLPRTLMFAFRQAHHWLDVNSHTCYLQNTQTHQSLAHAASRCALPDTQFEQASRLLTADISKIQCSATCCTVHAEWYCGQPHMLCDTMYYVGGGLYAHLPVFALAAASCSLKLRGAQQLVAQRRDLDLELLTAVTKQQGADKLPAGYSHLVRRLRMPPNNDT